MTDMTVVATNSAMPVTRTPKLESAPFKRRRTGRNVRAMDTLYEAGKILSGSTDGGQMLSRVLAILSSFVDLRFGAVALLVDPDDRLDGTTVNPYVIAATTTQEAAQPPGSNAMPRSVAEMVFRTGIGVVVQNVAAELPEAEQPDHIRAAEGRIALIAAPIEVFGETRQVLGALSVFRFEEDGDICELDQDLRLISMIATLMGQAIRFRRMIARDRSRLIEEAQTYSKALADAKDEAQNQPPKRVLPDIVGNSPAIRSVCQRIEKVAPTRSTVLLRGESGTGKELFARAIHELSDRKKAAFVKVNCAALTETLLESELFGHEKGAFTGATAQKKGRFELADGGTLFLDEIGEISPAFQAKLLRVLQEGEFERVGGTRTIKADIRLVAATNKNLEEAVAKGDFRADLYFRICVIPIELPPLRDRPGDIPHLAATFLTKFNAENGTNLRFADDATKAICRCYFPGNVRELENCVNRVAALAAGPEIEALDLACSQDACMSSKLWEMRGHESGPVGGLSVPARKPLPVFNTPPSRPAGCPVDQPDGVPNQPGKVAKTPREELIDAMEQSGWVQAKAARLLGLTPRQIGYALKKHNIPIKRF